MTYQSLLREAVDNIPEFKKAYSDALQRDDIDSESGNHIVFSLVFVPLFEDAIKRNDMILLNTLSDFVEKMASSDDDLVGEVCDFTILEELCDRYNNDVLIPLFKPKTLEDFYRIRQYVVG